MKLQLLRIFILILLLFSCTFKKGPHGKRTISSETNSLFEEMCKKGNNTKERMVSSNTHIALGLHTDFGEISYTSWLRNIDPDELSFENGAYLSCANNNPIACTGTKHFPNLSISGLIDPHVQVSKSASFDMRDSKHFPLIIPSLNSVKSGACTIMTSHIPFTNKNGNTELCSINKSCIEYIRKEMNFNGLIVTDEIMVMKPVLYEIWSQKYKPIDMLKLEEWNDIIWKVDTSVPLDPSTAEEFYEAIENVFDRKFNYVYNSLLNRECGGEKYCNDNIKENIKNDLLDINGSQRAESAILAGNDLIMVFHEAGQQEIRLNKMVESLASSAMNNTVLLKRINESVLRILKKKESIFGKDLYKNTGLDLAEYTPNHLLNFLTIKEKIKQVILPSGEWPGETELGIKLEMGSLYYMGPAEPKNGSKSRNFSGKNKMKIPPLFIGDVFR